METPRLRTNYLLKVPPSLIFTPCRPELLKIVHVFFGQNAVLFEFARLKLTAADASFRAPYIIKDSISWENVASAGGFEIHYQFAQNRLPHEGRVTSE